MTCFDDGTIQFYVQGPMKKGDITPPVDGFQGKLGQEMKPWAPRPPEQKSIRPGGWTKGPFGCYAAWEADIIRPEQVKGDNVVVPLWPGDGYIFAVTVYHENYRRMMSEPIELWQPGANTPIKLPIMIKELIGSSITYSHYKDVYIVPASVRRDEDRPSHAGYKIGIERPVYFISRNGSVETKWFPNEDWIATGEGFLPTVAGNLVASNFTRRASSHDTGVWLVRNGRSHKIITHLVDEFSVSPNGCKAVVSIHNPDKTPELSRSMTLIDFCAGKGRR